ncbi:MAG: ATP-binding protein [Desulfovibrio sp.]|nr:ATP-binding protein [Desulfovibrio sp.]
MGFTRQELSDIASAFEQAGAFELPDTPFFTANNLLYHPFSTLKCFYEHKNNYDYYLKKYSRSFTPHYFCVHQGDAAFVEARDSEIYVDKSELLIHTNRLLETYNKYLCLSRPRRFGKTISANMLAAYYDVTCRAKTTFKGLKIAEHPTFLVHANQYIVIKITLQTYLSKAKKIDVMLENMRKDIIADLSRLYAEISARADLTLLMRSIAQVSGKKFVIVIDEWDCLFREFREHEAWQEKYLDFLRLWFKDQDYIALVYMTGILPIKKYGTHSASNMFNEYSMLAAAPLTEFVGFTESEVKNLCLQYKRDFLECKRWYDGYQIEDFSSIYNPRSVTSSISSGVFRTYWNTTESYEALKVYITMAKFGLKDAVIKLLANASIPVQTGTFANDMKTFGCQDDILTLLVHLGYLSYDAQTASVRIPNKEIAAEFVNAIQQSGWPIVVKAIESSKQLLEAVLNFDAAAVAKGVEAAHLETSQLQYNDENALAYTISLAFFAAREHYTIVREFPAGKGFADLVFLPRPHCPFPILLIELKWDKTAKAAIAQISQRQYPASLAEHEKPLLLVGINYDRESKKHTCHIERYALR